ncbi:MAG TPA: T9SS type B sorting domain-containing protein, partial [Anditalea sp.]|nr:T9SS type B sorting domain-containing protein [Anditalea sp.]
HFENNRPMIFVDIDDDLSTVNSSSATLQFANENNASSECTEVIFAGLYWSGRSHNNMTYSVGQNKRLDKREIKLKGPSERNYTTLRANDQNIYFPRSMQEDLGMFVGFVDVTDYVKRNGEGEYTVADLATIEGTNYFYGGWGMVVVYENFMMNQRDITVFDGYALMNYRTNSVYDLPISGFSAVSDGPVNVKMGIMAGEGDRPVSGDYLEIEKGINSGDFVRLSHGMNDPNNFFNASIFTGNNPRNPSIVNNSGTDLAVFYLPNDNNRIIGNNQTSTKFRYGTDYDNYVIYNMVFAIDANELELEPVNKLVSINSIDSDDEMPTVTPGDELQFMLTISNLGEVDVEEGKVVIPLPIGLSYLAGSEERQYNFNGSGFSDAYVDPDIGEYGSLIIKFGTLPQSDETEFQITIKYTLKVEENCESLRAYTCRSSFDISGEVSGVNVLTQIPFDRISLITDFEETGSCQDKPVTLPIQFRIDAQEFLGENCGGDIDIALDYCMSDFEVVDYEEVAEHFSAGVRFFNEFPISTQSIEYTMANPFPLLEGTQTYYAVLDEAESCYSEVKITGLKLMINAEVVSDYDGFGVSCFGSSDAEVNVIVSAGTGPYTYLWNDPNQTTTSMASGLAAGEYMVTVTDANGCEMTVPVTVTSPEAWDITFEASSAQVIGDTFISESEIYFHIKDLIDVIAFEWDFGDGNSSFEENPRHVYEETGAYEVVLNVMNINGCPSTFLKLINIVNEPVVEEADHFFIMPEAFTPNGDRINDHFYPKFNRISALEFLVFNKWGETIYSSNELQGKGWDGSVKGKEAPSGNYVYKVFYTTDNGERLNKSGVFLLIR